MMDRCRTVVNVTGDTVVCGMVSHMCPVEDAIGMDKALEEIVESVDSSEEEPVVTSKKQDKEADSGLDC